MRSLFWRRSDHRLARRVSSIVERSEQVRRSTAPKQRRVLVETCQLHLSTQAREAELAPTPDESSDQTAAITAGCPVDDTPAVIEATDLSTDAPASRRKPKIRLFGGNAAIVPPDQIGQPWAVGMPEDLLAEQRERASQAITPKTAPLEADAAMTEAPPEVARLAEELVDPDHAPLDALTADLVVVSALVPPVHPIVRRAESAATGAGETIDAETHVAPTLEAFDLETLSDDDQTADADPDITTFDDARLPQAPAAMEPIADGSGSRKLPAIIDAAGSPFADMNSENKRRDRRVAAQTPAMLTGEGILEPLYCIIRDKSASGAMLELGKQKTGIGNLQVGRNVTLAMTTSRDRTAVVCLVVWVAGRRCGVRFCGQFVTEKVHRPRMKGLAPPNGKLLGRLTSMALGSRKPARSKSLR